VRLVAIAALLLAAVLLPACGSGDGGAKREATVVLALDFTPNAAHAPIYEAVRRGFDRQRGVRIQIRAPGSAPDSLKLLAAGRADLGVLDIQDLALARARGADLVGVAALVQRPLGAIIALPSISRPRDLEGHRVGVSGLPSDPAFLRAIVEGDGGDFESLDLLTIGFAAVPNLIQKKVDAVPAFWNAEGVTLRRRGVPVKIFRVEDYGAPRYPEVVLVTSRRTLERRREAIVATLRAIGEGTRSTLADPEPVVRRIAEAGSTDAGLVRAQLAAIRPALSPPLKLDRAVLLKWAAWDERFHILPRRPDVDRTFVFGLADGGG
jgi:NitT/TauT family transport system substrate-binding protein/putative hydroxymethylpyrimidine transport system substrate-binding protein